MAQHQGRWLVGLVLIATVAAGCTGVTGMTPSASTSTAVQGWENFFTLDWTAQATPDGREIDGYINNTYGTPAGNVQVLAQAVDASGAIVGQKLAWVPGVVPPKNRSYFRVAGLPPADAYRVSVWAFDWLETGGDDSRQ